MPKSTQHSWHDQCELLRGLVFDETQRQGLQTGEGLFRWTDSQQLARFAGRVADDVRTRQRRGAVPLEEMYGRTLVEMDAAARRVLTSRFCVSRWFARYGELPDRQAQLSLEEAFYRFLCDEGVGEASARYAEFIDVMIRALSVQPSPAFQVPSEIQGASFGYYALVSFAGKTFLFAVSRKRLIRGPISETMAQVIRHLAIQPDDSGVEPPLWAAAVKELSRLGIDFSG